MGSSEIDLARIMARELGMASYAVDCVFRHGQVFLDDRCLGAQERHFPAEEIHGRCLRVVTRTLRIEVPPARPRTPGGRRVRLESREPVQEVLF